MAVIVGQGISVSPVADAELSHESTSTVQNKVVTDAIASEYSTSKTYSVGDVCTHDGKLYECIVDIPTAEGWTLAHWKVSNLGDNVSNLNRQISDVATITDNLFDKDAITENYILVISGGNLQERRASGFGYSDFIAVEVNGTYSFLTTNELGTGKADVFVFDSNKNFLGKITGTADENNIVTFTNTTTGAVYARINCDLTDEDSIMFVKGNSYPSEYFSYGKSVIINNDAELNGISVEQFVDGVSNVISFGENVLNLNDEDVVLGKILASSTGGYTEITVEGYGYSGYIPFKHGDSFSFKKLADLGTGSARVFLFDTNKNFIRSVEGTVNADDSTVVNVTITTDNLGYVIFNFLQNVDYMVVRGLIYPPTYHDYGYYGDLKYAGAGNVLYGKTLVTAGDSYTEAVFRDDYAEYNGKNYGYYIAERNGMTFYNRGISGSTMTVTDPSSPSLRSPFSYQRYMNIPETDYLTIWFGINDSAYAQLGTIDDTENTTFYGAWNKVLKYYLENRPYMKILIIITMSSDNLEFQEAVRNVAKKWGYPYLDFRRDTSIPAFFDKEDMGTEAQTLRRAAFGWNGPSAGHPNPKMYEYESSIIEAFLRRI